MIRAIYNEGYSQLDQIIQQETVNQLFPDCRTLIKEKVLFVEFDIQDPDYRSTYKLQIKYESQRKHDVFILKPKIVPSVAVHMYPNSSLCLYSPPDISPFRRLWIGKDLIQRTALWVCHYEQWLINGNIWKGREAPGHAELLQRVNNQR